MTVSVLWKASEIAAITGGKLKGDDFAVTGISIDTRTLVKGDLFIALKGPNFDGHEFIETAFEKGAAGVLVENGAHTNQITVPDCFRALQDLGAGARDRSKAKIVAVTGSVGKTSVKAMLTSVLSAVGKTHAAEASLNNHWGVPLSLARMPVETEYAVFEIGMNHAGEITPLSKLVSPHVAIITTIASAHIQHLGSIENIALAKSEIFQGMSSDGVAILPRDSEQYSILLAEARTQGLQHIYSFGEKDHPDVHLVEFKATDTHSQIKATLHGKEINFTFGVPGKHQAINALSVLAVCDAWKIDPAKILPVFADMSPVSGRGNRKEITIIKGQLPVVLIDETHNASPIAVRAALNLMAQLPSESRRIVILGDMLELGEDAPQFHAELASAVEEARIDRAYLSGPLMKSLANALPAGKVVHFADSVALTKEISTLITPGDMVLVKGSRGSKMKLVVDAIQELGQI